MHCIDSKQQHESNNTVTNEIEQDDIQNIALIIVRDKSEKDYLAISTVEKTL